MKIGIVTFYRSLNYGAMLQAFSLMKYLEGRGHTVEFLTHTHSIVQRQSVFRMFLTRSLKGYFTNVRNKIEAYLSYPITSFADQFPTTDLLRNLRDFRMKCSCYDAVIVGSDQMWNHRWVVPHFIPFVFLDLLNCKCKRISYAASFSTKAWNGGYDKEVGTLLRRFDAISVREKSAVNLVKELSGRDAEQLADPVLLNDSSFFEFPCKRNKRYNNYIFKYMINGWIDGVGEKKIFQMLLNRCKVKRIYDDMELTICGFKKKVEVAEWLLRLRNSKLVVTNSFHGVIFSILFHKEFIVFPLDGVNSGMNERIYSILEYFEMKSRLLSKDYDVFKSEFERMQVIDWRAVDRRLSKLRLKTDCFFSEVGI